MVLVFLLRRPGSESPSSAAPKGKTQNLGKAPPPLVKRPPSRTHLQSFWFSVKPTHPPRPCSSAAHRFDHRPSGNQDQRDQAGVRSPDQDREPAGRDKRPPRHYHGNTGQHQLGPVPHYLLVSPAKSRPMNHCGRHTFKRVKGHAVD